MTIGHESGSEEKEAGVHRHAGRLTRVAWHWSIRSVV